MERFEFKIMVLIDTHVDYLDRNTDLTDDEIVKKIISHVNNDIEFLESKAKVAAKNLLDGEGLEDE